MPILRLTGEEAIRSLRSSRATRFPDDRVGSDRLKGIAKLTIRPSFKFAATDRILTIGSCFARELEARLSDLGFDIPTAELSDDPSFGPANGVMNKYTVHAMENELRWASGEPQPSPDQLFLEIGDGLWWDPQLIQSSFPQPLEHVVARRKDVETVFRQMASCRVVIITLGLVEAWYDHETDLYLNVAPPFSVVQRNPGRFSMDCLSYEEILASLQRIHAILVRAGHPDFRMLVTVSPVPFKVTFSGQDALIANTYGKSVQRAAAEAFAASHENVDYFPSYEMVALSPRDLVYESDNIHVSQNAVAYIMDTALSIYVPELDLPKIDVEPPQSRRINAERLPQDLIATAKHLMDTGEFEAAVEACKELFADGGPSKPKVRFPALIMLGTGLLRVGDARGAAEALDEAATLAPTNAYIFYKLGAARLALNQQTEAVSALKRAVELNHGEPRYRKALDQALARIERSKVQKSS